MSLAEGATVGVKPEIATPLPRPAFRAPPPEDLRDILVFDDIVREAVLVRVAAQERRDRQAAFFMWGVHL